MHPTPVFLPGEFHGQRGLAGNSPWGCKELDIIELLTLHFTSLHYWKKHKKLIIVENIGKLYNMTVEGQKMYFPLYPSL